MRPGCAACASGARCQWCHGSFTRDDTQGEPSNQGHEPVEARTLKVLPDGPSIINVRFAGYAHC